VRQFKSLTIEIENSGSAFDGRDALPECARLLRGVIKKIGDGDDFEHLNTHHLHDAKGNRCGTLTVESEQVEPDGWLCDDCLVFVENGDLTGVDYYAADEEEAARRCEEIESGARQLGSVHPDSDMTDEFSRKDCDCCGTMLAGSRTGYYLPT
jgi:hypothetical protein